ncbi:MAG: EFR1 family ferrodoxin [Candidatus Coatesbacteria bacterium]|nr:EFR1 family ferrodoxin [Candidatus Coatesbacteria bacterium]
MDTKVAIIYFSATGNTEMIAFEYARNFQETGANVDLIRMEEFKEPFPYNYYDFFGFGFPIWGCRAPIWFRNKILQFPEAKIDQKAFIFGTSAGWYSDAAIPIIKILKEKKYNVVRASFYKMPSNIIISSAQEKFQKRFYQKLYNNATLKVESEVREIIAENKNAEIQSMLTYKTESMDIDNLPKSGCILSFLTNYMNTMKKLPGHKFSIKRTKINDNCIRCQLCYKSCPVNAIKWIGNKPLITEDCILCMRCINNCPVNAIETFGIRKGSTYKAPDYSPPILRNEVQ